MGPILNETKLYRRQQVCFELLSQVPLVTFAFSPCRTRIFVRDAFARLLNCTGTLEVFFFISATMVTIWRGECRGTMGHACFGILSEGEVWEGLRRHRTNIQKIFQYVSSAKTHVEVVPNLITWIANL